MFNFILQINLTFAGECNSRVATTIRLHSAQTASLEQLRNRPLSSKISSIESMTEPTEPQKAAASSDEELDVTSSKFNPLKALYSKKVKIPIENACRFDNVSIFLSRLDRAGGALDADLEKIVMHNKKTVATKTKIEKVDEEKYHVTASGRTFLKEQGNSILFDN